MAIICLYTAIPKREGLLALKHVFRSQNDDDEPISETIADLFMTVINSFSFSEQYCKHANGITMSTTMGYCIDDKFFSQYNRQKPDPSSSNKEELKTNSLFAFVYSQMYCKDYYYSILI